MTSRKLRLLAAPPLLLLLVGGAFLSLGSGKAEAFKDNNRSETMEQYLTAVTKDVDAYWTQEFKDSGLPEPRVSYDWIPAGQTAVERLRRRERARRQRRRLLPGGRHDLHLAAVRHRHLQRRARPGAARQLAGLRPGRRRLRRRLHRRPRVRPSGPGRARRCSSKYGDAGADDGVRAPGRLLRRHVGQAAPRTRTGSRTATSRRRSTPRSRSATSSTDSPGHHGTPEQREAAWKQRLRVRRPVRLHPAVHLGRPITRRE